MRSIHDTSAPLANPPECVANRTCEKIANIRPKISINRAVLNDMMPGELTDRLFGTRAHTEGAMIQIPRKIPLRIEPKTYFANERTFLSWMSMAVTLGSVGTAIAGFAVEDESSPSKHKGGISQKTVQLMTLLMLPISICMIGYALFTFYMRSEFIRRKQIGFFDDKIGPVTVAIVVEVALLAILFASLRDVLFN